MDGKIYCNTLHVFNSVIGTKLGMEKLEEKYPEISYCRYSSYDKHLAKLKIERINFKNKYSGK